MVYKIIHNTPSLFYLPVPDSGEYAVLEWRDQTNSNNYYVYYISL